MLELDHVFVCVPPDPPQAQCLREMGFTVEFQREHPGQGTRNNLLLFERNYLELLSLANREEAQANMIRLDRRCDWKRTGASPFGVALRGRKEDCAAPQAWTSYTVPGHDLRLWILSATLQDPRLPLVFVFDADEDQLAVAGPKSGSYAPRLLHHANGASDIVGLEICGPGYGAGATGDLPRVLALATAPTPRMRVSVGGADVRGEVGPALELV